MSATYFLMKTMPQVAAEMALHVQAYSPAHNEQHGHPATHGGDRSAIGP
jgi:hypothetical protein